jgi:NAD(P)-dependent dehydrogenase (short-subunit alcohol dehydrogenase family)
MPVVDPNSRPVLVTGAARRIGRAIAERFARDGRPVVLHGHPHSAETMALTVKHIVSAGGCAASVLADLGDPEATDSVMARAEEFFGPPVLLVNNASIFEVDTALDFTVERFDRHLAINLRAPVQLARAFAATLPDSQRGSIVNFIDQRVWRLTPQFFTYTLAKAALWTATQTLAQAYAPRIRVNGVGPGPVLPNEALPVAGFEHEIRHVLLESAVPVEQIVKAVVYLDGAESVTGQMIAVDSGQHLAWRTRDVEVQ